MACGVDSRFRGNDCTWERPYLANDTSTCCLWRRLGFRILGYLLNYMHNNPVERGLVKQPGDCPWSRRGGEILFLK